MPDDHDKSPPEPKPLEYRAFADDRTLRAGNVAAFIVGLFAGVALVLGGVFAAIVSTFDEAHNSASRPATPTLIDPVALMFFAIAAASMVTGILLLRRQPRRFMLIGFLLGIGLGSMVEGICFFR